MRSWVRGLTIALPASLLLASLAFALGAADAEEPPRSFTIPPARLGDRADYLYTLTKSSGSEESGRRSVTFTESVRVEDEAGTPRNAVRVDVEGADKSFVQYFFDYETRFLFRKALWMEGVGDSPADGSFSSVIPAPPELFATSVFESESFATELLWQAVALQGHTWHAGEDLSPMLRKMLKTPAEADGIHMWIGEPSQWDGTWVWPVRSSIVESGDPTRSVNTTLWFSESQPMPVRYDGPAPAPPPYQARAKHALAVRAPVEADQALRDIETLESFSSGSSPIPWGPNLTALNDPKVVGKVLPTPFPSGGRHRMGLGIEDAVALIEADRTLVRFAEWKKTSPDYRVVYFGYESGFLMVEETPRAFVVGFASLKSNTIFKVMIRSVPFGGVEPWLVTDTPQSRETGGDGRGNGPLEISKSARGWEKLVPDRSVTLGAVDDMWRVHADPQTYANGPELVDWGFDLSLEADPGLLRHVFSTVDYGGFDGGPPFGWRTDRVVVDLETGRLAFATASQIDSLHLGVTGALTPEAPQSAGGSAVPKGFAPSAAELGAAASLLLLIGSLYPWLKTWFVALYSKLTKAKVLENNLREHIIELVRANPGLSPVAIQRELGVGEGTVQHHLRILHRNHILTSVRDGRHRRVFLVGQSDVSRFREIAVLRNPVTRRTWDLIGGEPGITRETLAERLDITLAGVSWHLRRLQSVALVRREEDRRTFLYFRAEAQGAFPLSVPVAA